MIQKTVFAMKEPIGIIEHRPICWDFGVPKEERLSQDGLPCFMVSL
jgi:hypothetical protein